MTAAAPPRILHVDLDAFFVSVERLHQPELRSVSLLIVGGHPEGRGVVTSASYEARRFGVRSAMASAIARRLCPEATFVRPNFERYRHASRRVMEVLGEVAPVVQPMGLDEAYLDMSGTERALGPLESVAERIRKEVRDASELTCSIGGATGRFVAKMATNDAKPDGVRIIAAGEEAAFLAPLAVDEMHGVGDATAARLHRIGVRTIGDLAAVDPDLLASAVGDRQARGLRERARGIDRSRVVPPGPPKSIGKETTFAMDLTDPNRVETELARLTTDAIGRLRRRGLAARTVTVKLRDDRRDTRTRSLTLPAPTRDERAAIDTARALYGELRAGRPAPVRLIGVTLSGLTGQLQQEFFGSDPAEPVDRALDAIRRRFGAHAVDWGTAVRRPPRRGE